MTSTAPRWNDVRPGRDLVHGFVTFRWTRVVPCLETRRGEVQPYEFGRPCAAHGRECGPLLEGHAYERIRVDHEGHTRYEVACIAGTHELGDAGQRRGTKTA